VHTVNLPGALLAVAIAITLPSQSFSASAEPFRWSFLKEDRSLVGREEVEEGDHAFHATCSAPGMVQLGIGADIGAGSGEGEKVSITLTTSNSSTRLDGFSRRSANFEMTAGIELQATVRLTHPVFQLLLDPGVVKVTGDLQNSLPAAGRAAATGSFIEACRK